MVDFEKFQEEIKKYLKENEISIFPYQGRDFSKLLPEMEWYDVENWKDFFSIAKKEGITIVYEEIIDFSEDKIQNIKRDWENSGNDSEFDDEFENIFVNFEDKVNEISSVSYSWIKNNILHSITEQASWLDEAYQEYGELKHKKKQKQLIQRSGGAELPESLKNEKPENIVNQMLEFLETEHPEMSIDDWRFQEEFFESIGLDRRQNTHRVLREKVLRLGLKIMDDKEKEMIPGLIEKCVEWSLENKQSKPTQAIIRGFLTGEDVNLSTDNFRILHAKLIVELQSLK
ncbi:MAG: hypothetical protein HOD60_11405 [Candidatus Nitrosopelagicus sp.]|jgi:hypothetical protein|nr:hypothetical protein [Candidatus Nitrosopelagicus sp.]